MHMNNLKKNLNVGEWVGRRFWESRQFYSAYIALFISISNWITIQYKLLLENVPFFGTSFINIWTFIIIATILFTVLCILGGHYIHRKRQFKIEQAVAVEANPYLYISTPGKERDLMVPIGILQLESLEELLRVNDLLTDQKKHQFDEYRKGLTTLMEGKALKKDNPRV